MTGVRGRVVLTVLVVTAVLYSLLGTIGFVQLTDSSRDAIRERVDEVVDQLEASLRSGNGTARFTTPDGVVAVAVAPGTQVPNGGDEVRVEREIDIDGTRVTLVGRASQARVTDSLRKLHRGLWIAIPLAVLLTAGAAALAMRRAMRPVSEITALAATIGVSDVQTRVPVPNTDDEIAQLARTVNEMLDRIAAGRAAQQQFTSDAAHELRTPLMALQGEIELATRHPDQLDDGLLERLDRQRGRLSALVDDLVLLSTLDEHPPLQLQPVDLLALVRSETESPVVVDGTAVVALVDERLVARAVRNLVANAARHARSTTQVHVVGDGDRVWIHVDDDGPGISEGDRTAVFQRFARLDQGRSTDRGGAGLGLAIVASVASAHGGSVQATASPLGGSRISIVLPA